jgi:hypothetical protein
MSCAQARCFDPVRPARAEHGLTHLPLTPANGPLLQPRRAAQLDDRENATLCAEHVP